MRFSRAGAAVSVLLLAAVAGLHAQTPAVTASPLFVDAQSAVVGQSTQPLTVTFTFHASEYLNQPVVYTEGAPGGDFLPTPGGTCVAGTVYNDGQSCTVIFQFTPATVGRVRGAVVLLGDSVVNGGANAPIATSYVSGTGTGGVLAISGGTTTLLGTFPSTYALHHAATDRQGNLYTVQPIDGESRVVIYHADGTSTTSRVIGTDSASAGCCGIALDGAGNLYSGAMKADAFGGLVNIAPDLPNVVDVVVDGAGNAYLLHTSTTTGNSAANTSALAKVTPDGTETTLAILPQGAAYEAIDAAGNIYVSCQSQFVKVAPNGAVTNLFSVPYASPFAVDAAGILYFSFADISGVQVSVPYTYVNGNIAGVDSTGGILYTQDGVNQSKVIRLNRNAGTLKFPATVPGTTSAPLNNSFRNVGNAVVIPHVSGDWIGGADASDFMLAGYTCDASGLEPAQTCASSITFTPGAMGDRSATAYVASNAPGSPQSIQLSGAGMESAPVGKLNTTSVNFGNYYCANVGTPASTVTLTNTGTAPLKLASDPMLGGANSGNFFLVPLTCAAGVTLAPQQSCSTGVFMNATSSNTFTGTLSFLDNASNSPQQVLLTGTGNTTPFLSPNVTSLLLQASTLNQMATPEYLVFTNTECGQAQFTGMSISGPNAADFSIVGTSCGPAPGIGPNSSCSIEIGYTPTSTSVESATLTVTDNASQSQSVFPIHGLFTGSAAEPKK